MTEPAYLTFDDGPDPGSTPAVLDALDAAGARGTFFVLGERVHAAPELVERTLAAGHRVELHGFAHSSHEGMTAGELEADTERGLEALREVGVEPARWRPPYGAVTEASFEVARRRGLELTAWTADPRDWSGVDAKAMLTELDDSVGPHAVVLLHDGVRRKEGRRTDAGETAGLIGPLVAALRERGCDPQPLPSPGEGGAPMAIAGFAGVPWSLPFAECAVVEEAAVGADLRSEIGEFIADLYEASGAPYRGRAWRTIPPVARVLARAEGELIGHVSLFAPRAEPAVPVAGIGDLAVAREWRRRGVARALLRGVVCEGWRRGAQVQLAATEAVRVPLGELGLEPARDFAIHWEDEAACHRDPHWVAARSGPLPGPLRLLDPDF